MIEIIGITVDEHNPLTDYVTDLEGDKIPIHSLYKLNKIDQTKIIINRAGKTAPLNEIGVHATPTNVKIGDLLIYEKKYIFVELKQIEDNTFTVFDGRTLLQLPNFELRKLKSDRDLSLDQTLPKTEIDFNKEEVNIDEIVAYRYVGDKENDTIYKSVKVVELYPEIIVTNGLTRFAADPKDIFGIKAPVPHIGDKISPDKIDRKEVDINELELNQKVVYTYENENQLVEIKDKTRSMVLVNYGSEFTMRVPIKYINILKK